MTSQEQTQQSTLEKILLKKQQAGVSTFGGGSNQVVDVNEKVVKLVIFSLGDQWYAFYGESISEILPKGTMIFFVPGCPPSLTGVINVRGEIESVINISMFLKLTESEQAESQNIVLLAKSPVMSSGVSVDKVIDVVDVPERIIQSPTNTLPDDIRPYVLDVLEFRSQAVTVLDVNTIFKDYQQGLGS